MTTILHPQKTDLDRVYEFMTACDIEEFGKGDTSREDLDQQWEEFDLQRDVWIACDDSGKILAYASVYGYEERYTFEMYLHRSLTPIGVEDELAAYCLKRINELTATKQVVTCSVNAFASSTDTRLQKLFERNGFVRKTFHYRMQIDFDQPLEKPEWPENYSLSAYTDNDEDELYELVTAVFDWEGHITPSLETWRDLVFRGGRYDPEYFIIVREGNRLVGAALTYAEDAGGWIRQLAIAKDQQGKGLGGLLLRHMFWMFFNAGLNNCALGMASANRNAGQFYEHNGMKKTREFIEYRREV